MPSIEFVEWLVFHPRCGDGVRIMDKSEDMQRYRREKEVYCKSILTAIRSGISGKAMYDIVDSFCLMPHEEDIEEVYWFYVFVFLTKGFSENSERGTILSNCKYAMMAIDPKRFSGKYIFAEVLLAIYRRSNTEGEVIRIAEMIGALVGPNTIIDIEKMSDKHPEMTEMSRGWISYLEEQIRNPVIRRRSLVGDGWTWNRGTQGS